MIEHLTPGIYHDISNSDYHNPDKFNALSAGGIKTLLRSPAHFKAAQTGNSPTPAMIFGSAAHTLVLQPELAGEEVAIIPEDINRRTKQGKQMWEDWQIVNAGKYQIKQEEYDTIQNMRFELERNKAAMMLLEVGKPEVSAFWFHPLWGFHCKCRPDFLVNDSDLRIIADYKTTQDASPEGFGKASANLMYDMQAAWYVDGLKELTGEDWQFVFIAQEKTPPYASAVYSVPDHVMDEGRKKCEAAAEIYRDCLESGKWPGYSDQIMNLEMPKWAFKKRRSQI